MTQNATLLSMSDNPIDEVVAQNISFLISFDGNGKKIQVFNNGIPVCFQTTMDEPVGLEEFIDISLNIPEEHLNNFSEEFDCDTVKILNVLNWCKIGGKWVTCKGACPV